MNYQLDTDYLPQPLQTIQGALSKNHKRVHTLEHSEISVCVVKYAMRYKSFSAREQHRRPLPRLLSRQKNI